MKTTRRTALAATGCTAATLAGARPAQAQEWTDWREEIPEHVTITFDRSYLETYQPKLVTRDIDPANLQGMYGFVATSPEYEYDVCVYAASYAEQTGVSPFAPPFSDSHFGDHEWAICHVNKDTGDLEELTYAAYHWIAGRAYGDSIPTDGQSNRNPLLHIISPWHNYSLDVSGEGAYVELYDLKANLQSWLDNGMNEHLHLPCVADPETMRRRNHWWQNTAGEFSLDAFYAEWLYNRGWFGADVADDLDID